jgi:hypothetical protein
MSLWAVGGFEMKRCYSITGGIASDSQVYSNVVASLDGDLDKIRVADDTQDEGGRIVAKSYYDGRPVVPSTMPDYLVRGGPLEYPLHDLYLMGNALVGTRSFKDAVEAVEPGVHQFFPVKIIETEKSQTPVAERFLMVICNRLDSLHHILCEPPFTERGWPSRPTKKYVFSNQAIGKAHVWVDKFVPFTNYISEKLHARLERLNLTGSSYYPFDVAE